MRDVNRLTYILVVIVLVLLRNWRYTNWLGRPNSLNLNPADIYEQPETHEEFDLHCSADASDPHARGVCHLPNSVLPVVWFPSDGDVPTGNDIHDLCHSDRSQYNRQSDSPSGRYLLAFPDNTYPFQRAGTVIDRIIEQLQVLNTRTGEFEKFPPVVLDLDHVIKPSKPTTGLISKILWALHKFFGLVLSDTASGISPESGVGISTMPMPKSARASELRRLPGDQTGELFLGPNRDALERMHALLIDCQAPLDLISVHEKESEDRIYVWPPIAGRMPKLPQYGDVSIVDDATTMQLRSTLTGLSARQLFNHIRSFLDAWYSSAHGERVMDVGRHLWVLYDEVANVESSIYSTEPTVGDLVLSFPDEILTSRGSPNSTNENVVSPPKATGSTEPVDVPFFSSGRQDFPDGPFNSYETPGTLLLDIGRNPEATDSDFTPNQPYLVSAGPSRYGIVSIGGSQERRMLQDYLWTSQEMKVNYIEGMDCNDEDLIRDHFPTITDHDVEKVLSIGKPIILVHSHALAAKYGCDQGLDAVVVIEDDAYPIMNARTRIENTIDALQANGRGTWGYHSTGAQNPPSYRPHLTALRTDRDHSLDLAAPYGIVDMIRHMFGTYGQIINCQRFYHTLRTYFLDEHERYYLAPSDQYRQYREAFHIEEGEESLWKSFTADRAYQNMFRLVDDYGPITNNTISIEPIISLSLLEWAKPTNLHDRQKLRSIDRSKDDASVDVRRDMLSHGFPGLNIINDNRRYFNFHMSIPRKQVCVASIMEWLRSYEETRLSKPEIDVRWLDYLGKGEAGGEEATVSLKKYFWRQTLARATHMTLSRAVSSDSHKVFYPCMVHDTVPVELRNPR